MSEENKNNSLLKKIQNFTFKNYIQLIISLVILLIIFFGFQTYNYLKIQMQLIKDLHFKSNKNKY